MMIEIAEHGLSERRMKYDLHAITLFTNERRLAKRRLFSIRLQREIRKQFKRWMFYQQVPI